MTTCKESFKLSTAWDTFCGLTICFVYLNGQAYEQILIVMRIKQKCILDF